MKKTATTVQKKAQSRSSNPDPVDIHVGSRLRLRRGLLGITQEQLGNACGLTFQQIQKYERGTNRIGASRLYQFAQLLGVQVDYFFDAMTTTDVASSYAASGFSEQEQASMEAFPHIDNNFLDRRETLELIRAYYRITEKKTRRKVYELIKSMAE